MTIDVSRVSMYLTIESSEITSLLVTLGSDSLSDLDDPDKSESIP